MSEATVYLVVTSSGRVLEAYRREDDAYASLRERQANPDGVTFADLALAVIAKPLRES